MRQYLLTKFICSICGNPLLLTHKKPEYIKDYCPGEPTGAERIESLIYIEPCKNCEQKNVNIKNALKTLLNSTTENLHD